MVRDEKGNIFVYSFPLFIGTIILLIVFLIIAHVNGDKSVILTVIKKHIKVAIGVGAILIIIFCLPLMIKFCSTVPTGAVVDSDNDDSDNDITLTEDDILKIPYTPGTLIDYKCIAWQDDYLYYRNISDGFIYRIKISEEDKKTKPEAINKQSSYFINVVGDYVYYSNADSNYNLYRVQKDGKKDPEKINDDRCLFLHLSGGFAYYQNIFEKGSSIYSMSIYDNSHRGPLNIDRDSKDNGFYITVVNNRVYYCIGANEISYNGYKFFSIGTDGTGHIELSYDACSFINVDDGWIYYCNNSKDKRIYKMKTNGEENKELTTDSCSQITFSNGWIYYNNITKSNNLHRMDKNGNSDMLISDDEVEYMIVVGEWLYYLSKNDNHIYKIKTNGAGEKLQLD